MTIQQTILNFMQRSKGPKIVKIIFEDNFNLKNNFYFNRYQDIL